MYHLYFLNKVIRGYYLLRLYVNYKNIYCTFSITKLLFCYIIFLLIFCFTILIQSVLLLKSIKLLILKF